MADLWVLILAGALSSAAPLILAGVGECILQRGGAGFSLGIEGQLLLGALAGVAGAEIADPWTGLGCGLLVGLLTGSGFALGVRAGIDTVLVGIGLTIFGTGLSTYLHELRAPSGHTNSSVATISTLTVPGLADLPVIGPLFRNLSATMLLALVGVAAVWWMLQYTRFGLRLRSVGEDPERAAVRGLSVHRYRAAAAVIAGGFSGVAGANLSLAAIGSFTPFMSNGRGFIVLAVVIIARRTPLGVVAAGLLFAILDSAAILAQTRNLGLPVEAYQALPYVVPLLILVLTARNASRRSGTRASAPG